MHRIKDEWGFGFFPQDEIINRYSLWIIRNRDEKFLLKNKRAREP